ncbi:hypothetical protein F5X97DRAFT_255133 [Nemania serpens]|nr:hypothetical protein F5X97DRAFT_255133 [Nemania serpens]
MADLQKPAPAKRALPFKRTAKQRPPPQTSPADDDGLELFSQSKTYFPTVVEDQQKRAREKAEKAEQERKERLAREHKEAEARARRARLGRERTREEAEDVEVEAETDKGGESTKKRRRHSPFLSDAEEDKDHDFIDRPSKSHKKSTLSSPESGRGTSAPGSYRGPKSARPTRISKQPETSIVLLDSSDDEVPTKRGSKDSTTSPRIQSSGSQTQPTPLDLRKDKAKVKVDDSDSDLELWEDKKENKGGAEGGTEEDEEDPSEFYIKAAMERMRKAKEARLARGSSAAGDGDKNKLTTPGVDEDDRGVPVSIMIAAPALSDAKPLCCTVRTAQALQIAFDTFKERQKTQTAYPHKMISELVFTWRGDRVYHTTKLETLGIRPRGSDGRLYDNKHTGRAAPEGYLGSDKVYFEAWTPEDYDENQRKQERERKLRTVGEWWDQDDAANDQGDDNGGERADAEAKAPQQEDDRVKVIFKARDMPPRNVTLRKHSTVAHMIKAFRKLAGLGEDKHVEIRWDGEVLDLETTVEEADIGDMDSVEVHVR